jgi:hypothetical protein
VYELGRQIHRPHHRQQALQLAEQLLAEQLLAGRAEYACWIGFAPGEPVSHRPRAAVPAQPRGCARARQRGVKRPACRR